MHDKKAEWVWGVLAEVEAAGLIVLADEGYQGAAHAKVPYKGKNKPESRKAANRAHAKLRSPGERANAQLKTSSRPGASSASSAAAPGAPGSSPRPSTHCRSAGQTQDERLKVSSLRWSRFDGSPRRGGKQQGPSWSFAQIRGRVASCS